MSTKSILSGVRVIEMSHVMAAPTCGLMLADMGADVIKVERPDGGDPFRAFRGGFYSPHFQTYNRNKRSITIDLKTQEGTELLRRLAAGADVLIQNFRPGVVERLGVGGLRILPHSIADDFTAAELNLVAIAAALGDEVALHLHEEVRVAEAHLVAGGGRLIGHLFGVLGVVLQVVEPG